jgi:hypothetical protein
MPMLPNKLQDRFTTFCRSADSFHARLIQLVGKASIVLLLDFLLLVQQ